MFLAHSQKIVLEQKDCYGEVYIHRAGTILEDQNIRESENQKEPEKKKKKKSIIQKIKDKIKGKIKKEEPKVIEVTTDGNNVVGISTKILGEEVVSDGSNNSDG